MINVLSAALTLLAFNAKIFERSAEDPIRAQERVLLKYLAHNRNTEYGLKYGFNTIRSIEAFRSRLPLTDYPALEPYIQRMARGENNILTKDKAIFFGITSGSTGRPKLIPVTKYSRDKKSEVMALWAYYVYRDHPNVFEGKILSIISPEIKNYTEAKIPYGPEDGHAYNNLPEAVKRLYVLPYEIFYMNDYDARYYCMLRIAMEENVTTIATLNPSTIVLLCQRIAGLKDKIIEDIEKGTLSRDFDIPVETRKIIERRLKPNPKRAAELKALLAKNKELLPKDFWPDMELIECWKGGTVKLYLKSLPQYFGDVAIRDFGCLSTEARSSVPMSDEGAEGVLAINTNFYEFIPREDIDKKDKRTLLCDQLEKGKEYALVVTTAGGLYRYNVDDVVRVNGFFKKTPVIEFIQKGHNVISITGEKVYESHVNDSVIQAATAHKTMIKFFTATVQMDDPPRYVFLVEFERDVSKEKKKALLVSIEKEMFRNNTEYEDIRRQKLLAPPILKVVRRGDFEKYRAGRVAEGAHDTQFKVMKLNRDPYFQKKFVITEEFGIDDKEIFE